MSKITKILFTILPFVMIFSLLALFSGCSSPLPSDEEMEASWLKIVSSSNTTPPEDQTVEDFYNAYGQKKNFNSFILSQFPKLNDLQLSNILRAFDYVDGLQRPEFLEYVQKRFDYSNKNFEEKIAYDRYIDNTLRLSWAGFYAIRVSITKQEFEAYIAENEMTLYCQKGTGYYANKQDTSYSSGAFEIPKYTTKTYLGDFLIENIREEKLNNNYQIIHHEETNFYFQQNRILSMETREDIKSTYLSNHYFFHMEERVLNYYTLDSWYWGSLNIQS